jgi:hypothetical protein
MTGESLFGFWPVFPSPQRPYGFGVIFPGIWLTDRNSAHHFHLVSSSRGSPLRWKFFTAWNFSSTIVIKTNDILEKVIETYLQ